MMTPPGTEVHIPRRFDGINGLRPEQVEQAAEAIWEELRENVFGKYAVRPWDEMTHGDKEHYRIVAKVAAPFLQIEKESEQE